MKTLKIISTVLCWLALCRQQLYAQCTPAASLPAQGIFPDTFASAKMNVAYSQILQFKVNTDTVVSGVTAKVDSIRILGMIGLPPGFIYQCNKPACNVLGGEIGCALVSGTATQMGFYPLQVPIKVLGRVNILGVWVAQTQVDTNTHYSIRVNSQNGIFEIVDHSKPIKVYPNPATNKLFIDAKPARGNILKIKIYNTNGELALTETIDVFGKTDLPAGQTGMDISALSSGIYFAQIEDGNTISHSKFVVN